MGRQNILTLVVPCIHVQLPLAIIFGFFCQCVFAIVTSLEKGVLSSTSVGNGESLTFWRLAHLLFPFQQ